MFKKIKLRMKKNYALFEVRKDIEFIEKFKSEFLIDESSLRSELKKLKTKGEAMEEKDYARLAEIQEFLTKCQATKTELRQLKQIEVDLPKYLSII